MALALLLLSKTKTEYFAKRHGKENEHWEDVAYRTYAGALHLSIYHILIIR